MRRKNEKERIERVGEGDARGREEEEEKERERDVEKEKVYIYMRGALRSMARLSRWRNMCF